MKVGFITTYRTRSNKRNNALLQADRHRSMPRWICLSTKTWRSNFWDAYGIILIGYLQRGRIINDKYYATLLERFNNNLKTKQHFAKRKALIHKDDTSFHTCAVAMAKLTDFRSELLPHPPYLLDYFSIDYFLILN